MKNRCTLNFKSIRGNEYLYDDALSLIIPWGEMDEEILQEILLGKKPEETLKAKYSDKTLSQKSSYISYIKNCGGFLGVKNTMQLPSEKELTMLIGSNITKQLVLSVTDDCNLNCKYCFYSDAYYYTKNKTSRYMSQETAKKAIDYFYQLIKPQLIRNPKKMVGITFYGGEPLLNMQTIKFAVNYINKLMKNKAIYTLTTNGILLNDEIVEFLSLNKVKLSISIDGPQDEHDRLRVRKNGNGSYQQIAQNLMLIKEQYPDYYKTCINAVCVYDPKTNIKKVEKFYEEMETTYNIPRALFVNQVISSNTDYYNQFTENETNKFYNDISYLKGKFYSKKIKNEKVSSYLYSIVGGDVMTIFFRRRAEETPTFCFKSSGACMPGYKIAVDASGNFNICERVNGTNPIGNVNEGLNPVAILDIINQYNKKALKYCDNCEIQRICGLCFQNFETDSGIMSNEERCIQYKEAMKARLVEYVSIYEENPKCKYLE